MSERSTLVERTEFDRVILELDQNRAVWLPWFVLVSFSMCCFTGPVFLFLAISGLLVLGSKFTRPKVLISMTPREMTIDTWGGYMPVPSQWTFPMSEVSVQSNPGVIVNGRQLYTIRVTGGGKPLLAGAVDCSLEDLEALRDRVEGMRELARLERGRWDGDVPESVEQLLSAAPRHDEDT